MDLMYETDENFMQIINNDEYNFQKLIAKANNITKGSQELTYDVVADLATSPATKRGIYQALKVVREITDYMGYEPKNIIVEMVRSHEKKERKDDRKKYLQKLYDNIKEEVKDNYKVLKQELDNEERIDTDKLYLYYLQEGKCLYCGTSINVDDLDGKNSLYEIDHILPRTLIKDDSWDNRALVCRKCNQEKGASLVLPKSFRNDYTKSIWHRLKNNGLMSNKKLYRLTRAAYSEEDIKGFINRQLVETRQITKHVANILSSFYTTTKIVYFKANISSSYRNKYELYKFRDINDYHHAHDAYLAAVLGKYQEKYLHYDLDYEKISEFNDKLKENKDYRRLHHGIIVNSLDEEFQKDFAEIAPKLINEDTGEIFNAKEFNELIENTLYRNDILISRKTEIRTGKLFKEKIYNKDSGDIPIKKNMLVKLYGGYSNVETSYLALVKYGAKYKLIGIPMSVANNKSNESKNKFIKEHLKISSKESFEILKDNIPYETNINYKGQDLYVKGYSISHKNCELANAHQLKIKKEVMKKYKHMLYKVYKNDYSEITALDIENAISFINYLFNCKEEYPLFKSIIERIESILKLNEYSFEQLSNIIKQLLVIYHCNTSGKDNLKEFGLSERLSRISLAIPNANFIFTSTTGLKGKKAYYNGEK